MDGMQVHHKLSPPVASLSVPINTILWIKTTKLPQLGPNYKVFLSFPLGDCLLDLWSSPMPSDTAAKWVHIVVIHDKFLWGQSNGKDNISLVTLLQENGNIF